MNTTPPSNASCRFGYALGYAILSFMTAVLLYGLGAIVAAFARFAGLSLDAFGGMAIVTIWFAIGYYRAEMRIPDDKS